MKLLYKTIHLTAKACKATKTRCIDSYTKVKSGYNRYLKEQSNVMSFEEWQRQGKEKVKARKKS